MRRRSFTGFTLIELLIVVAIIGIIAAIAVPNLMNAINRGKQKRTMADLRGLGTALEAYSVDTGQYPAAGSSEAWTEIKAGQLASTCTTRLIPTYIKRGVEFDGWLHPVYVGFDIEHQSFGAASFGKDGVLDADDGGDDPAQGATTDFNSDIVFMDGAFIRYPAGLQQ